MRARRGCRRWRASLRSSGPAVPPPGHQGPRTVPSRSSKRVPNRVSPMAFTCRGRCVVAPPCVCVRARA